MLTVYVYNATKPPGSFDLSLEPLATLTDVALGILSHHKTATLWFGYLEGWMLEPTEETRLRTVIRTFDCHVMTREPFSFSQAWKNEIRVLHLQQPHGASNTDDNGCIIHSERPIEHKLTTRIPSLNRLDYQN